MTTHSPPPPHDAEVTTITGLQFVQSSQFQLKLAQDIPGPSQSRGRRIFSTFFDNSDETQEEDAAAISADPALYWAKLKRNKARKKNGALRGSYAASHGRYLKYSEVEKNLFVTLNKTFCISKYYILQVGNTKVTLIMPFSNQKNMTQERQIIVNQQVQSGLEQHIFFIFDD